VIYDGVWVGEGSKIPNHHGIRSQLVAMMKQIHFPVIRWPGGCFADSYDWKDGIGEPSKRPRRTNFWEVDRDAVRLHEKGLQIFESNAFGTNEFIRFCWLTEAQPHLAANVRSLPALDFDHWVEYCNSPAGSPTLAEQRTKAFQNPLMSATGVCVTRAGAAAGTSPLNNMHLSSAATPTGFRATESTHS
jgi:alpha-N-arabinofuranosidase